MWKWVTLLCVGMYATLMALGGEGYDSTKYETASVEPQTVVVIPDKVPKPEVEAPIVKPEVVATVAPVEALPAPTKPVAVTVTETEIAPIAPVAEPIVEAEVKPERAPAISPPEIWRVTGTRVNLRAAANAQSQIVGRTVRGDSAEIIELLPNGWAKVYIIDSGIEAFMSASFIAPEG